MDDVWEQLRVIGQSHSREEACNAIRFASYVALGYEIPGVRLDELLVEFSMINMGYLIVFRGLRLAIGAQHLNSATLAGALNQFLERHKAGEDGSKVQQG